MAEKTPDEILEEQRAEATKEYAAKIHSLHLQEIDAEEKLEKINKTIDDASVQRKKELDSLEADLRARIAEADNKSAEISILKRDAEAKLKQADEILAKVKDSETEHQQILDHHLNSVDSTKELLANKSSQIDEREKNSLELEAEAKSRLQEAMNKEKEIEEKADQLVHINQNVNDDIAKQKDSYEKNQAQIEELRSLNAEALILRNKNADDLANLIVVRDSIDAEKKAQINRKLEISEREQELQQKNVKLALDLQRLQSKEQDIATQAGKLNELKNNVESLMKSQGKEQ